MAKDLSVNQLGHRRWRNRNPPKLPLANAMSRTSELAYLKLCFKLPTDPASYTDVSSELAAFIRRLSRDLDELAPGETFSLNDAEHWETHKDEFVTCVRQV